MSLRPLILVFAMILWAIPTRADIYVEPVNPILSQALSVRGWAYQALPFALPAGGTLRFQVGVNGGLNSAIQAWLVDERDYQLLQVGAQFNYFPASSGPVAQSGTITFTAPVAGNYYVVFDNRQAFFTRSLFVRAEQLGGPPNPWSNSLTALYSARYAALKNLLNFDDFDVTVRHCGQPNAFSDPNITICTELLEDLQQKSVPQSEEFIFFHEVGHSLLRMWGDPNYDNEDTADQFATAMMVWMGRQDVALQAAQWFAARNSVAEAQNVLSQGDPHSLSIQRARNVLNWLNQRDDRLTRWLRLMTPHMTDATLVETINRNANSTNETEADGALLEAMRAEVEKRRRSASNESSLAQATGSAQ
jgi:hypothetical protein